MLLRPLQRQVFGVALGQQGTVLQANGLSVGAHRREVVVLTFASFGKVVFEAFLPRCLSAGAKSTEGRRADSNRFPAPATSVRSVVAGYCRGLQTLHN